MNTTMKLVPYPQEVLEGSGKWIFRYSVSVRISEKAIFDIAIANKLDELGVNYEIDSELGAFEVAFGKAKIAKTGKTPERKEAYCLKISKDGAFIDGFDLEGLFWGLTTFEQLLDLSEKMPYCTIKDWPAVEVRGHFDDISRKRVSTNADFKHIIRRLSRLKINYYGMYIEDVLHLEAYPDIGEKRGKLMPWDVREILEIAEQYKVNVVPFFQLIGHCENLLDMPNYKHLGKTVVQKMSSLDPTNPEVRVFLKNCIQEVAEMFPCKYFGMGFDETQGLKKDEFFAHANWCAQEIAQYDKIALLWADMVYNHYGIKTLKDLDKNIIPIDWQYGSEKGEIPFWAEMFATGRRIWGFGGYNSWCKYLPDFEATKDNIDIWARTINKGPESGLFYSQWGDNGYENNRDLPWNLFAYAGECSWRGDSLVRKSFESRFQTVFFGSEIPILTEIITEASELDSALDFWTLHRKDANAMLRIVQNNPDIVAKAIYALNKTKDIISEFNNPELMNSLKASRMLNITNMFMHFGSALFIMHLTASRIIFAFESLKINEETDRIDDYEKQNGLRLMIESIEKCRDFHMKDWLSTNRPEGLEVSAEVYNSLIASYQRLLKRNVEIRKGYKPVDLSEFYNTFFSDVAAIPIGAETCDGVPFIFAGVDSTHLKLEKGEEISIPASCSNFEDLHMIVTTPMPKGAVPSQAMKVELLKGKKSLASETVDAVTHVVDWFAPMGEHMWAGGGFEYADKSRVSLALKPEYFYGLMRLSGFEKLKDTLGGDAFDTIKITALAEKELVVFAVTIQE